MFFKALAKQLFTSVKKWGTLAMASQIKLCLNYLGFSHNVSVAECKLKCEATVLDAFEKPVKQLPSPSPSSVIMVGRRDTEKLRQQDNLNWFESGSEVRITDTEMIDTIHKLYFSHAIHIY